VITVKLEGEAYRKGYCSDFSMGTDTIFIFFQVIITLDLDSNTI
jgi:hypothetical protein